MLEAAIAILLVNLCIEVGVHTEHEWHPTMVDIVNFGLRLLAVSLLILCTYC